MRDGDEPGGELAPRVAAVFDLVGPLYRKAYRSVEGQVARFGLSVGERAVLVLLYRDGPKTVPQLARAQALTRQFVQRTVNEAAERNLVELAPNPAHRKSSLVRLTEQGRSVMARVHDEERRRFERAAQDLTTDELDACLRVLSRLVVFLGEAEEEPASSRGAETGKSGLPSPSGSTASAQW